MQRLDKTEQEEKNKGAVAAPPKKKKPDTPKGSARLLILWYNVIAKNTKPTKG